MISANHIRDAAAKYLLHDDPDKFVLELAELSYNIHLNGDAEAIALSRAIEFKMADLRSGCMTLSDFKASLRKIITPEVSIQAGSTTSIITGAGLEWSADPPRLHLFVDTRFAWV